jgi:hypothetical protein
LGHGLCDLWEEAEEADDDDDDDDDDDEAEEAVGGDEADDEAEETQSGKEAMGWLRSVAVMGFVLSSFCHSPTLLSTTLPTLAFYLLLAFFLSFGRARASFDSSLRSAQTLESAAQTLESAAQTLESLPNHHRLHQQPARAFGTYSC